LTSTPDPGGEEARYEQALAEERWWVAWELKRWEHLRLVDTVGPRLDFEQLGSALEDLVGSAVTANICVADIGSPFATFSGWLNRVHLVERRYIDDGRVGSFIGPGYTLVLRAERIDNDPRGAYEGLGHHISIPRWTFRAAGEGLSSDEPGPLTIDVGPMRIVLASRQPVNWTRYSLTEPTD
jgi:hypothetical protein